MKIESLLSNWYLNKWQIYNVFAICDWPNNEKKYYIQYLDKILVLYPFDTKNFEIIDTHLSEYWHYGKDINGDICIWPKEIFTISNFWERLYNWDKEIENIVKIYHNKAKGELFN